MKHYVGMSEEEVRDSLVGIHRFLQQMTTDVLWRTDLTTEERDAVECFVEATDLIYGGMKLLNNIESRKIKEFLDSIRSDLRRSS